VELVGFIIAPLSPARANGKWVASMKLSTDRNTFAPNG
jgi:hypothetical protein